MTKPVGVYLPDQAFRPELLYNGHGGVEVGDKAFLEGLLVVVCPPRPGGPPLQATLSANLLVASEKQDAPNVGLLTANLTVPPVKVVLKFFNTNTMSIKVIS